MAMAIFSSNKPVVLSLKKRKILFDSFASVGDRRLEVLKIRSLMRSLRRSRKETIMEVRVVVRAVDASAKSHTRARARAGAGARVTRPSYRMSSSKQARRTNGVHGEEMKTRTMSSAVQETSAKWCSSRVRAADAVRAIRHPQEATEVQPNLGIGGRRLVLLKLRQRTRSFDPFN